jgi:hypothetical protein
MTPTPWKKKTTRETRQTTMRTATRKVTRVADHHLTCPCTSTQPFFTPAGRGRQVLLMHGLLKLVWSVRAARSLGGGLVQFDGSSAFALGATLGPRRARSRSRVTAHGRSIDCSDWSIDWLLPAWLVLSWRWGPSGHLQPLKYKPQRPPSLVRSNEIPGRRLRCLLGPAGAREAIAMFEAIQPPPPMTPLAPPPPPIRKQSGIPADRLVALGLLAFAHRVQWTYRPRQPRFDRADLRDRPRRRPTNTSSTDTAAVAAVRTWSKERGGSVRPSRATAAT